MAYRDIPGTLGGFGEIVAAGLTPRRRRRKALDDPFLPPWAERADDAAPDPFDDVFAPPADRKPVPKKRAKRDDDPFVTGVRQAWQRGGRPLKRHRDGLALSDAVGPDAANRRQDVARVEALLGGAGALDVTATEGPTGYFGRRTDAAIRKLQRERRLKVDGLITPKGPTLKALMASLPRAPVPAFAVPKAGATVGRDARAANGRLVDAVMKTRGAGIVPKLLADAVAKGPSGEAEVADFFAQLAGRDTSRARDMATLVAAERARPDLPDEGGEPEGGDGQGTPPVAPEDRPTFDPCIDQQLDAQEADRAYADKLKELQEVARVIGNNELKLADLRTLKAEFKELGDKTLPSRAGHDPKVGKMLKTIVKWADLVPLAAYLIKNSTKPHNPLLLDGQIAALDAQQAELEAQHGELEPEVERLRQERDRLALLWRRCKAAQGDSDGQGPTV